MASIDFEFDGHASNEDNLIQEVHTVINRGIFPDCETFYRKDLVVEGYKNMSWVPMNIGTDYVFSPLFIKVAAATGLEAFSYIVLKGDLTEFTRVRLTVRAVGKYRDDALLNKLALSTFNRESLTGWLGIKSALTMELPVRDPELEGKNILEVLNAALSKINTTLATIKNENSTSSHTVKRIEVLETQVNTILENQ